MTDHNQERLTLQVSDVSAQKRMRVEGVPAEASVGELVDSLLQELNLPVHDASGRSLRYHARLEREARHVHDSEIIGDAFQPGDQITLQPDIQAG